MSAFDSAVFDPSAFDTEAASGGTSHNLQIGDLSGGAAIDSVSITQNHALTIGDLSGGSSISNVTGSQEHKLSLGNLSGGSSIDPVVIGQTHNLTIGNLSAGSSIDAVAVEVPKEVDTTSRLQLAPTSGGSSIDSIAIGQQHVLIIGDMAGSGHIDPVPVSVIQDTRYARPSNVLAAGPWQPSQGADLVAMVNDESTDTFIRATTPGACELQLNPVAPSPLGFAMRLSYPARSSTGSGLVMRLKQHDVVIAEWMHASLGPDWQTFHQTLAPEQQAAITDSNALRLEAEAL